MQVTGYGKQGIETQIENLPIDPREVSAMVYYTSFDELAADFTLWMEIAIGDADARMLAIEKEGLRNLLVRFFADDNWHEARLRSREQAEGSGGDAA